MDLAMTLRMCRLMVSRMHLAETDGAVWLFPASSGAAPLVGVNPLDPAVPNLYLSRACSGYCVRAGDLVARIRVAGHVKPPEFDPAAFRRRVRICAGPRRPAVGSCRLQS